MRAQQLQEFERHLASEETALLGAKNNQIEQLENKRTGSRARPAGIVIRVGENVSEKS